MAPLLKDSPATRRRTFYALPGPEHVRHILPWRPRENAVARVFCDIITPDETPFEGDPRFVLRRNIQRAARVGYTYYVGPEIEYFYFHNDSDPTPMDGGGYFDQSATDLATDMRRETVLMLEELGIPVEASHHEVAPSQHEIDLRHTDALTMADTVMTYKLVVKEIAQRHGCYATFMPKPIATVNGSGMHIHQSLFEGGRNAFYDAEDPDRLSSNGRHFIAGLLRHAREITAVTNQWVNSYKRLVPNFEAPVPRYLGHGQQGRPRTCSELQAGPRGVPPRRVQVAGPSLQSLPRLQCHARSRTRRNRKSVRAS